MRYAILAIFISITLVGTVCQAETLADEQILRIGFDATDLRTLDPHFAAANVDRAIVDMIFNGLVRFRPGDIQMKFLEADLAEKWEVSKDGTNWTFHLRKGVMFHPWDGNSGYEMTSEDVIYSFEKAANPKRSAFAGAYSGMSFQALDKYTVRISMEKPLSPSLFLAKIMNYAGGFIVSKRAVEKMGDEQFRIHPVGTGPFIFKKHKPMEKVVLARNESHFRGSPKLKQVEILYIPDLSARNLGLRKGELDLIEGPMEQSWVDEMRALAKVEVDVFGPGTPSVLHFNMTKPPLDDLRIRRAVAYALSRDELIAAIGSEVAEPVFSAVPGPYLPGGLTKDEVENKGLLYSVNRKKAKELLTEAGYPEGFRTDVYHTEMASMLRPMESVQAQLRKVGIDLNLRVVDHSSFHSLIRKDASPIVHYMAWRPNADAFLTRFYHSNSTVVSGKKPDTNFSHYNQIDYLIERARESANAEKQTKYWKEAQIRILEDVAAISLFIKRFTFARKSYVDYGYELKSNFNLFPPIRETTRILAH